jgi:Protein of unknown function (DUF2845)
VHCVKNSGRIKKHVGFLITIPFLLLPILVENALGLPCKGQIVNIGDTEHEVTAKCGEAVLKEQRTITVEEVITEGTGTTSSTSTATTTTTIDEWTYDFGPEELVQTCRFEKGKLMEISSNGYGAVRDFSIDTCRNGKALAVGDGIVEIYLKCGEPIAKERLKNKVIESAYGETGVRRITVPVVEWTYRYGLGAPGYTITFENGVAANIRTREFGK